MSLTQVEQLQLRMFCEKFAKRVSKYSKVSVYGVGKLCKNSNYHSLVRAFMIKESLENVESTWDEKPDDKRCVINKLLKE